MRRRKKKLIMSIATCILAFIIGAGASYYYFGIVDKSRVSKEYQKEIEALKIEFGGSCYKLNRDVEEGEPVRIEDFDLINIPSSISSKNLMNDLDKIDGAYYSKDLYKNRLAYKDMFYNYNQISNDIRTYETTALSLPINIETGDYVDVRINFPSGLDYVVLSKKKIKNISRYDEAGIEKEVTTLTLSSEEILRFSSALVDAYMNKGTSIYTTKYISAYNQEAAEVTYPSNKAVQELMKNDPNVVKMATIELEGSKRDILSSTLSEYQDFQSPFKNNSSPNRDYVKNSKDEGDERSVSNSENKSINLSKVNAISSDSID